MGRPEVQVLAPAQDTSHPLAATHRAPPDWPVCSLGLALWTRPNNGSRMTRECHVRFCESAGVRSPRATHLVILCRRGKAEAALQSLREIMGKLKLTVSEEKTRICKVPEGEFDFLGYSVLQRHGKEFCMNV